MTAAGVPLYDHAALYAASRPRIDAAMGRVLTSGKLDWGPEVPAFEDEFAAWLGAGYAVGVGSGTAALKAAFKALGVGPGDEVITVTNTDIAGSSAIRFVGACTTEDPALAERLRMVSAYGQSRIRHTAAFAGGGAGLHHETDGLNERMDELQAAILRAKMLDLDATLAMRRAIRHGWQVAA